MIFVVPRLLTDVEIALCRKLRAAAHHDDGHGDGGHSSGHQALKQEQLPWVAARFAGYLTREVDPAMKFYRLSAGEAVAEHVDADYSDARGQAVYSVLIPLNDDFEGGETLFGANRAPQVEVGGALVFSHRLRHSGRPVLRGEKLVLKTDAYDQGV